MTSNMEDSGTLTAIYRLQRAGKVDPNRLMVLRTVSNYTMPPTAESASWSTTAPYPDNGLPALKAAYHVGRTVINEITANWEIYKNSIPAN